MPRTIAMHSLLSRLGKTFILDQTVDPGLTRYFPKGTRLLSEFDGGSVLSRNAIVGICRDKNGVLVTSDLEYASALAVSGGSPWAVIMLPADASKQLDALRSVNGGRLVFQPVVERAGMFEYVRRNRLLVDLRQNPPTVTVHSDCLWIES